MYSDDSNNKTTRKREYWRWTKNTLRFPVRNKNQHLVHFLLVTQIAMMQMLLHDLLNFLVAHKRSLDKGQSEKHAHAAVAFS